MVQEDHQHPGEATKPTAKPGASTQAIRLGLKPRNDMNCEE